MGHLPGMVKEVRQLWDELHLSETGKEAVMTADSDNFSLENIKKDGKGVELLIASGEEGKEKPTKAEGGVLPGEVCVPQRVILGGVLARLLVR